ncbi:dysbindin isoform X1 [Salmo salar]|uniref:Dysbindin isoform X1 n=1 Tax=Salmo salar TaxID=8030 RepID=A0A1S3P303_SALSA|nr:dysbindin-like isoform X1 [Salmo salar]|eukprot:XP_014022012.1 PREDICTED: dysbindin-like isoform X1 [Salmo salar]
MSFHLEQADKGEEINLTTQISVLIQVAEAETEHAQRVPGMDVAQQMKLRERQRFFEEVFQHDVDVYLSSAHLQIHDYKRPPIGSVSSMEVNVDMLEQMDLMDISDQEALDVFLGSGGDEGVLASPLPGKVVHGNNNNDKVINQGRSLLYTDGCDGKFRMSSTSSTNSQNTNEDRRDTQVVQSDDEDVHVDTVLLMGSPPGKDEEKDQSILSS